MKTKINLTLEHFAQQYLYSSISLKNSKKIRRVYMKYQTMLIKATHKKKEGTRENKTDNFLVTKSFD